MYSENEKREVVLTMTRDDYHRLLMLLGASAGASAKGVGVLSLPDALEFINRLNEGNPVYTPYAVFRAPEMGSEMPTYCFTCGAFLRGGATLHHPDCELGRMIEITLRESGGG